MTVSINNLTSASSISEVTLYPVWNDSDTQKVTGTLLLAWLQANLSFDAGALASQYAAPSATGFTVTVDAGNTRLIVTPQAGYAAGTIALPVDPVAGDKVVVTCTQAVTTLTVSSADASVAGEPTTIAANGFFTMEYDAVLGSWYRVG